MSFTSKSIVISVVIGPVEVAHRPQSTGGDRSRQTQSAGRYPLATYGHRHRRVISEVLGGTPESVDGLFAGACYRVTFELTPSVV